MADTGTDTDFVKHTALITGAARGIGKAIAYRLQADGHRLILFDKDEAALEEAADHFPGSLAVGGDVRSLEDLNRALYKAQSLGGVDILVNNAGVAGRTGPIEEQTDEDLLLQIDTILTAFFRWSRAVVPNMRAKGWGRIIYISSVAGKEGNANRIPYSMVEAAVLCLAKALSKEVAAAGILVNAIAPAVIETDLLKQIPKGQLDALVAKIPLGRAGQPAEVAAAVSFLVSEATFTTGQAIDLSGGRCTY